MAYVIGNAKVSYDNRQRGTVSHHENLVPGTYSPPPLKPAETGEIGPAVSVTSITVSSQTATLTATAHGLVVGDIVRITGAAEPEHNGHFTVLTRADADTATWLIVGTPGNASGTIVCRKVRLQ